MLYVIWHGETDLNKEGRLQRRDGLPLNGSRIEQARILSTKLENIHFDLIYSSPQERAIQTAKLTTGKHPIIDHRLDVFDLGEADGKTKFSYQVGFQNLLSI